MTTKEKLKCSPMTKSEYYSVFKRKAILTQFEHEPLGDIMTIKKWQVLFDSTYRRYLKYSLSYRIEYLIKENTNGMLMWMVGELQRPQPYGCLKNA